MQTLNELINHEKMRSVLCFLTLMLAYQTIHMHIIWFLLQNYLILILACIFRINNMYAV